jgi:hypothetical protein
MGAGFVKWPLDFAEESLLRKRNAAKGWGWSAWEESHRLLENLFILRLLCVDAQS